MSSNLTKFSRVFAFLLLLVCVPRMSAADVFDDLEVHGFATQGFIQSTDNRFFGPSDDGSFEFREIGINAAFQPLPNLRLAGQLLSRRAGDLSDGSVAVDFAVADTTIFNDNRKGVGILVGRIKNPLGLYNETRDVAFTRPSIFVPQVIYYDKVRELILSADGVGVRSDVFFEQANVNIYVGVGRPVVDENAEHGFLGSNFVGDLDSDGFAFMGRVLIESPDSSMRASFSLSHISLDFSRGLADPIGDGDIDSYFGIVSLQLLGRRWGVTAEYMREPTKWRGFAGSLFDNLDTTAEGYYLQFTWQIASGLEGMVRYGESFGDSGDRSGTDFSAATFGFAPPYSRYSKIFTAGIRWDATENLMFRAEYQRHNGTFVLSSRENPDPSRLNPDWDLFALEASYRF